MSSVRIDTRELEAFRDQMEALGDSGVDTVIENSTRELLINHERRTIKNTPVGKYPAGSKRQGGALRAAWRSTLVGRGRTCRGELANAIKYAPYVEHGHRTRGGAGWVKGRFMLTQSEEKTAAEAERVVSKHIKRAFR